MLHAHYHPHSYLLEWSIHVPVRTLSLLASNVQAKDKVAIRLWSVKVSIRRLLLEIIYKQFYNCADTLFFCDYLTSAEKLALPAKHPCLSVPCQINRQSSECMNQVRVLSF